ncbi:phage tail protein [Pseudoalteromonas phenolica]|uniref:phage tail protein n=1 Tax=Pseudoalteromonas phenolica TaxID=161398 RepID=UPI00110A3659|nr:tail fiber protein [Pseudoalteromonas phenolica]TMN90376.1 phage tail protein [Pseudoalteromonas phenolica]
MSDAYLGEIRMFAGVFSPNHWSYCAGQLQAITDNASLFSLLDTRYGGDGRTTYGLPDMRGRIPVGDGQGPGLTNWVLGQSFGVEQVVLSTSQLPAHNHTVQVASAASELQAPVDGQSFIGSELHFLPDSTAGLKTTSFSSQTISTTGGDKPHENRMPMLYLGFIICMNGIYPSRN